MFDDAPKALVQKVEQVVRLIRSKGVGVYFVSQNPMDIPDAVLGQLGNRVQHALRAFTPRDKKAVRAAASTFRQNPAFDAEQAITELGVGEALVSTLDLKGVPSMVDRTLIRPPSSRLGPAKPKERKVVVALSFCEGRYEQSEDRVSAYEKLQERAEKAAREAEVAEKAARLEKERHYEGAQAAAQKDPRVDNDAAPRVAAAADVRANSRASPLLREILSKPWMCVGAALAANIPERKTQRRIRGQARSYKMFLSKPRIVGAALAANIPERKT